MKQLILPIAAMILVVVASNILVQYPYGDWLTWGAFTYPVAFLVTDLTNRLLGPRRARTVVYFGFAIGVVLSAYFAGLFNPVGNQVMGLRIAAASGTAFLTGQLLDVFVFNRLRRASWWRAPLVSSLLASSWDTVLFFSLAFYGLGGFEGEVVPVAVAGAEVEVVRWIGWAVGDFGVKMAMALLMLVPFRMIVAYLMDIKNVAAGRG